MLVILYKRHSADSQHKADKTYKRCRCSVWMEWNVDGKQRRKSAKTFSWETGQEKARKIGASSSSCLMRASFLPIPRHSFPAFR